MESFIKSVLIDLKEKHLKLEDLSFVLPSKRAGVFLKHQLSDLLEQPIFSPQIDSIEDFVEELSGLQTLPNTELLFRLYDTYKKATLEADLESFEAFSKWAPLLLQDFNEIDRYLIPQAQIFDYLNAIKELDHWSLETEPTDLIKNHLKFWKRLKDYYLAFTENLLQTKQGYQGLIYREASENLEAYIESNPDKIHVFLGFNALNTSESQIIQGLLKNELAHIYWDIDTTFINDAIHDAGLFTRQHRKEWNYFKNHPFNWTSSHYLKEKHIEIIGIPKLVGQAKFVGQLLEKISQTNTSLSSVAVVLGEENLLIPVLNSIPNNIAALNVTMGMPLHLIPLAALFEHLFAIHKNTSKTFYYKDVINIISHPSIYPLFESDSGNRSHHIISQIQKNNVVYLDAKDINGLLDTHTELIDLLFKSWEDNSEIALKNCSLLIFKMKASLNALQSSKSLELEYLYRFNTLFNQLIALNTTYAYLNSIAVLHTTYKELLSSETLDFKGEPLEGLQIMGVLESRVLDFETVIITAVNEGVLPSGKSNNSFIPFDVKIENNLPTYKEKDAVYTYHFYRLLQRAKNVYIIYNTEVDALKGGEKSRFITQLEVEGIHKLKHTIVSPDVPIILKQLKQIVKTPLVIEQLKTIASKGFSPSSLSNYIRNPLDFYYDKILGVKEFDAVEENIAANTLGSVIHNALEDFYKPYVGQYLTSDIIKSFQKEIKSTVTKQFHSLYKGGDFTKGKNLIIFEIAQRYISNFIASELESVLAGNKIEILAIEADESVTIQIEGLNFPIKLRGKVDRIDRFNGTTRVIDYKSGKVEQNKVEIVNWDALTSDYDKYSKSFQILCYAYMLHLNHHIELPIEAGIISFKNLKAGLLKFGKKASPAARTKDQLISKDTLDNFEIELKKLILEICTADLDFIEKKLD